MPSFGISDAINGIKSSLCGCPTKSTLSYIYIFQHYQFTKKEINPHNKTTEDPTYFKYCYDKISFFENI
jgi:hypothetical protein